MEQVGDRVTRQVELGQHERTDTSRGGIMNGRQHRLDIAIDIGHADPRRRRRYAQEAVVLIQRASTVVHAKLRSYRLTVKRDLIDKEECFPFSAAQFSIAPRSPASASK